jgi:hypothetical protein
MSKHRSILLLLLMACIIPTLFISQAFGSTGSSPQSKLTVVQKLPIATLTALDQAAINDMVPDTTRTQFGITADDLSSVRLLTQSGSLRFFVVVGDKGMCIVSAGYVPGASCTDTLSMSSPVTLFTPDPSSGYLIGGGIGSGSTTLETANEGTATVTASNKLFRVSVSNRLLPETSGGPSVNGNTVMPSSSSDLPDTSTISPLATATVQYCKRFAPSVLGENVNCALVGTMTQGNYYTPGTALRDWAEIDLASVRQFKVWYVGSDIASQGTGIRGYIGRTSNYYQAACRMIGGNTRGYCYTLYRS